MTSTTARANCLLVQTTLALLVTTDLEVLATLDGVHAHSLAGVALEAEHNLLGGLRLFFVNERRDEEGERKKK